jgi:hypothetical protein
MRMTPAIDMQTAVGMRAKSTSPVALQSPTVQAMTSPTRDNNNNRDGGGEDGGSGNGVGGGGSDGGGGAGGGGGASIPLDDNELRTQVQVLGQTLSSSAGYLNSLKVASRDAFSPLSARYRRMQHDTARLTLAKAQKLIERSKQQARLHEGITHERLRTLVHLDQKTAECIDAWKVVFPWGAFVYKGVVYGAVGCAEYTEQHSFQHKGSTATHKSNFSTDLMSIRHKYQMRNGPAVDTDTVEKHQAAAARWSTTLKQADEFRDVIQNDK